MLVAIMPPPPLHPDSYHANRLCSCKLSSPPSDILSGWSSASWVLYWYIDYGSLWHTMTMSDYGIVQLLYKLESVWNWRPRMTRVKLLLVYCLDGRKRRLPELPRPWNIMQQEQVETSWKGSHEATPVASSMEEIDLRNPVWSTL